ncbi:hypothetical protein QFJ66_10270 [Raoultella terrigena]|uniref:hypothetical protein n=1 Tax=Raoultella terrigena TaxID=577 RepID=UPI002F9431E0
MSYNSGSDKKPTREEKMKYQSLLQRFLMTVMIWFLAIFIMALAMFSPSEYLHFIGSVVIFYSLMLIL